jgi:LytS/YehU family sensor histidine kinase
MWAAKINKQTTHGLGLTATRERLKTLYGAQASCEIRDAVGGGIEIYMRIPFCVGAEVSEPLLTTAQSD